MFKSDRTGKRCLDIAEGKSGHWSKEKMRYKKRMKMCNEWNQLLIKRLATIEVGVLFDYLKILLNKMNKIVSK